MPAKEAAQYSKKYSKFVMGLLTSSDKMEKFRANPHAVAKAAGLTQKQVLLIRSGKAGAILAAVDPAAYKKIGTFSVHLHVEPMGSPLRPPPMEPTWTSLPTGEAKKKRRTTR